MKNIKSGRYEHYKGKFYEVIGVAYHSETLEKMVVYRALYKTKFGKDSLWTRPYAMFTESVLVGGKKIKRFKYQGKFKRTRA